MTGEKNKFTTTEKLWKLDDETLSTPKHDEMVMWLMNKDNIVKVIPELKDEPIKSIQSEVPILGHNKFIIGYWDIVVFCVSKSFKTLSDSYYIEVKPEIKSFGATLRQLNTYKIYIDRMFSKGIYLFTTDTQFKNSFETQGIKVLD